MVAVGSARESQAERSELQVSPGYYRRILQPVVAGRRFLVLGDAVVPLAALGRQLRELGAERPFLLGANPGMGELPEPEEALWRTLDLPAAHIIDVLRDFEGRLESLPADVLAELDAWDPECSARCLAYFLLGDVREVAGRKRFAHRPPEWAALEDKTRSPAFLASIGVRRGALSIVPAEAKVLEQAAARIDRGSGTVWSGDASRGVHGGGLYVRWVRSPETAREASAWLAERCERVRVMPFLEGIPCSVHGIVFPEGIAVLRPIEMLTLRGEGAKLLYAGTATYWDPPQAQRDEMRAIARTIGAGLRDRVDYRGAYTVDGVLSREGFVPTELNTRIGAGLNDLNRETPELPLHVLALAAAEGERLDYRPDALEELVTRGADARRSGYLRVALETPVAELQTRGLVADGRDYRVARDGETPDGWLSVGPRPPGGFLGFAPRRAGLEPGRSFAPRCVAVLRLADELFGTGFGPLEAARDLHASEL